MLILIFIMFAAFFGIMLHYLHPIEFDGRNTIDETWHNANHVYRKRHVKH
jgi:hypothetical protein